MEVGSLELGVGSEELGGQRFSPLNTRITPLCGKQKNNGTKWMH
jgi:hypothetical protein